MASPSKRGKWAGTWDGGRIWRAADGSKTYWIERQVNGRRYAIRTSATTLKAAYEHLRRFEADPDGYSAPAPALYLDNELIKEFLGWSLSVKGNTPRWVQNQKSAMAWWLERFPRANLRHLDLRDILAALEKAPGRAAKVRVLKCFFAWLRKERHIIGAAEDPTFGTLTAPQSRPAQWRKSKVLAREHFLLAREHLTGPWPDLLTVLGGSGWHLTELHRFAEAGAIEPLPTALRVEHGAVAVLVCPLHKSGAPHRTAVSQEVLEAAQRVRARGAFSESSFRRAIDSACDAAKIARFNPGWFRHSVASWAFMRGADPAAISAFLGHRATQTVKRFYAALATAPKIDTLA
ncbi:MAG TPA: tyrosine-type recombinase/integrase [Anaeromyxobacteraceae bacterium]|nr:tyrosine-type recombinase/integrase [Anaeromyxobacteraceae bacterium]